METVNGATALHISIWRRHLTHWRRVKIELRGFRVRKDGIGAFFYLGHTAKKATREHVLLPHARQLSVKIVHGNISQRTLVYLIIDNRTVLINV